MKYFILYLNYEMKKLYYVIQVFYSLSRKLNEKCYWKFNNLKVVQVLMTKRLITIFKFINLVAFFPDNKTLIIDFPSDLKVKTWTKLIRRSTKRNSYNESFITSHSDRYYVEQGIWFESRSIYIKTKKVLFFRDDLRPLAENIISDSFGIIFTHSHYAFIHNGCTDGSQRSLSSLVNSYS